MPDIEAEELLPIEQVHYRQAIMPYHAFTSFAGDDVLYHDLRFPARAKNAVGIFLENPANQALSWELYGLHDKDSLPDDIGAAAIDTDILAAGNTWHDYMHTYPFPWYLLRLYFSEAPTDDPVEIVSVWIDLEAGVAYPVDIEGIK